MSEKPEDNQTGRGIEGIAHHFLSGMTNRTPAARRQSSQPDRPPISESTPVSEPAISIPKSPVFTRMIVLSDHLEPTNAQTQQFARQMAQNEGPMGMLDLTDPAAIRLSEFQLDGGENNEIELLDESIDSAWQELFGSDEKQPQQPEQAIEIFSARLAQLQERVETVLIHLPWRMDENAKKLIGRSDQVVLLCGARQEQLLKTYRLIKRLVAAVGSVPISIFFCGNQEEEVYVEVYEKLSQAAGEFLDCRIKWAGCERPIEAVHESQPAVVKRSDATVGMIYKFLGQTEIECGKKVEEPSEKTETNPASRAWKPLMVTELPKSDEALVKALAQQPTRWLTDVKGVELLELPLPKGLDERARVLTDDTGQLYVMLAGLAEAEKYLGAAMEVRHWLQEHFRLIQGYCKERVIDRKEKIGVILVGAGPGERKREWGGQLGFSCRVKQVYLLANESFQGILVV